MHVNEVCSPDCTSFMRRMHCATSVVNTNFCLLDLCLSFRCKDPVFSIRLAPLFIVIPLSLQERVCVCVLVCAGCLLDHHPHRNARPSPEGGPAKPAKQGGVGVRVCRVETWPPRIWGDSSQSVERDSERERTNTQNTHIRNIWDIIVAVSVRYGCGIIGRGILWRVWCAPVPGSWLCAFFCFSNSGTGTDHRGQKGERRLCLVLIRWILHGKNIFMTKRHTSAWDKLKSLPNMVCG